MEILGESYDERALIIRIPEHEHRHLFAFLSALMDAQDITGELHEEHVGFRSDKSKIAYQQAFETMGQLAQELAVVRSRGAGRDAVFVLQRTLHVVPKSDA